MGRGRPPRGLGGYQLRAVAYRAMWNEADLGDAGGPPTYFDRNGDGLGRGRGDGAQPEFLAARAARAASAIHGIRASVRYRARRADSSQAIPAGGHQISSVHSKPQVPRAISSPDAVCVPPP